MTKHNTPNDLDPQLIAQVAEHYKAILTLIGEDPNREGLVDTPRRAAQALLENTRGYSQDAPELMRQAVFDHPGSQIVIVRDIEFYSQCEHHILPFFGTLSVGYIPKGKIMGLSKLARAVEVFARRLQVQERLTAQVCEAVAQAVPNSGVIVTCQAQHLCMKMRGVEKQQASTTTMHYCGDFQDAKLRQEFFDVLRQ